jgi:adenine/guanine/hypoxanthine permease
MATTTRPRPKAIVGGALDRVFHLRENKTRVRREILAGTTTFLAMAYILAVNPGILSFGIANILGEEAAPPAGGIFAATALAAALGCFVMGLWARYPIALAPGMGLNAFFAFTVVVSMGISWQVALLGTFVSGVIFFLLAITGVREMIINAIPAQMKLATGAGIGLFIAFIGLSNAGIVVAGEGTLLGLGDFRSGGVLLAMFGLIVTAVCLVKGLRGGVFYGMIATALVGLATGFIALEASLDQFVAAPGGGLGETFGAAFSQIDQAFTTQMLIVVLTMLFVDFFDTAGTLFAVAGQAGMLKDGKLPRAGRALAADSVATMGGAVLGTSTTTSYIESSAGVAVGGRTGLTAVTTGCWFLLSLFFFPAFALIAGTPQVTAPALIIVGVLMASALGKIEWTKLEYAIPAFVTIIAMPLTYSIANGIALGLIFYPITMIVRGRWREVHPITAGLLVVFLAYFLFLVE